MSDEQTPIKIFVTGACAGLAEVRQALSEHPEIELVGTAVDADRAQQKLAASGAQVILHGTARADRLPTAEIEALRHATASPIILVTSGNAAGLLKQAVNGGIADVILLPQLTDVLVFTIRKTTQMAAQRSGASVQKLRPTASEGRVLTVFSPKGGVGKSVLACGLATYIARGLNRRVLLIDLDLQFGDVGIMMGIDPEKTIYDVVMTSGELDSEKLSGYVITHPTGVDIIPAPVRPEDAELISEERVGRLLDVAKETYDAVVVDTPAFFQATTLATLDRTDRLLLVGGLDIPTIKNIKLTLQTLNLLHYPKDRIHLVLNRVGAKGDIKESDIEKALDLKISFDLPNDKEVRAAVNRGVPVTVGGLSNHFTRSVANIATTLLDTGAGGKKGAQKSKGKSGGRTSLFSKSRKAA